MADDEVHVWFIKLCDDRSLIESAYSVLSKDERERAERFRFDWTRTTFVLSRGVLRTLLARFCDSPASSLEFDYGSEGKPFLANGGSNICFNMSHSAAISVFAVSRGREVGIDVEKHRPLVDVESIAARFFSPAEHRELMRMAESERNVAFFKCWVRKEAYIKACGGGLSIPLDSFRVSCAKSEQTALISVCGNSAEPSRWKIEDFSPLPRYSGAVAFRDVCCEVRLHAFRPVSDLF
jgi:4'-phosphopantetheinyl transferase